MAAAVPAAVTETMTLLGASAALPYIGAYASTAALVKSSGWADGTSDADAPVDEMENSREDSIDFRVRQLSQWKNATVLVGGLGMLSTFPPNQIYVYCWDHSGAQGRHWQHLKSQIMTKFIRTNSMTVNTLLEMFDAYNENGVKCWLDCSPNKTKVVNVRMIHRIYHLYVQFAANK